MNTCERINSRKSTQSTQSRRGAKGTKSIKTFTDQTVESDVINQLIRFGTQDAVRSGNETCDFAVITDKNEINRLSDELKKYLIENIDKYPYFQEDESTLYNKDNIFFNAPCLVLIYGDINPRGNFYDCTLAAVNIMRDAMQYHLRTCWIGFAEHACGTEEFKTKYKIQKHYDLVCALSVGYPKVQLPSSVREPAMVSLSG